mmetsp:Transcript_96260/g.269349  ORF Transcript_96260/g.269349 Transcript_96260/m.269349 type:complete len:81 (+) Transcript_96260:136-378(+)
MRLDKSDVAEEEESSPPPPPVVDDPASNSKPATLRLTILGFSGDADADVTTFCNILVSSLPENGRLLAHLGRFHSITFLM